LARIGIIGCLLVFVPVLFWGIYLILTIVNSRDRYKNERGVLLFAIAIILVHSLLEYPLHYLFFWLPLCFMMGLSDPRQGITWTARPVFRVVLGGCVVIIGMALLIQMWRDYQRVEAMYYGNATYSYENNPPLWFFRAYANYGYSGVLPLKQNTPSATADLLARHEAAIHLMPQPGLVRRTALLYAMVGETEKAVHLILPMRFYFETSLLKEAKVLKGLCNDLAVADRPVEFCQQAERWAAGLDQPK
jgi:hypothetical protein